MNFEDICKWRKNNPGRFVRETNYTIVITDPGVDSSADPELAEKQRAYLKTQKPWWLFGVDAITIDGSFNQS